MFTSCENGIDGEPTFTASVKTEKIEVPVSEKDTVWTTVYDTIVVRDSVIVIKHDTTEIVIEVVKKEGLEKLGEPGLEKIDDKSYLTWQELLEDGERVNPSTELNVRANIEDCDHDIIVVSSPIIGAPAFYASKSTRSYQDGDFTKLEFKATWIYNFGSFTEKVNTIHEMAWYKGWQMLSSYWTGGLKSVEYGEGVAYTYEGTEGTLYENTLTWEFTYNENDVRTFKKTHKFFVPNEGEPTPTPDKELISVVEKNYDNDKTYVITRYYDDNTYSDTIVVNEYGYEHSIAMPTLGRLYRDNTEFGKPTIAKNGNAVKTGSSYTHGGLTFQKMSQNMTASYNRHAHDITLQYTELTYTEGGKSCQLTVPMWSLSHANTNFGSMRNEIENNHNYEVTPVSFVYNAAFGKGSAKNYNTDTEVWNDLGKIPNRYGIASGAQSHTWDYANNHHIATIFTYNIYENGQLVGGGLKGYIDGKEVIKKSWSEVTVPAGSILGLGQTASGEWVLCRTYQYGDAFMWRSIENGKSFVTSIPMNQVRVVNNGKAELIIVSTYTENADGSVTVSSAEGSATAAAW